jgi:hypothetical protein
MFGDCRRLPELPLSAKAFFFFSDKLQYFKQEREASEYQKKRQRDSWPKIHAGKSSLRSSRSILAGVSMIAASILSVKHVSITNCADDLVVRRFVLAYADALRSPEANRGRRCDVVSP